MIAKKALAGTLALTAAGVLVGLCTWVAYDLSTVARSHRIIAYTFIDDIDVAGLTRSEAINTLNTHYAYMDQIDVDVRYHDAPVATFSADMLNLRRDIPEVVDHALLIGRSPHLPSRAMQLINTLLGLRAFRFKTTVQYDKDPVDDLISTMRSSYEKSAHNALFQFENGKVKSFKPHENGLKLQTDQFVLALYQALRDQQTSGRITLPITDHVVVPEITLSNANDQGIEELIGEGTSNYSHSIPSRIHNVKLAASQFNGVLVPKSGMLSFVKEVGDISSSTGYQPAYIIKNGRTVLGDGGGVCQVSTTLFRAALNTGLPIIERNAHAYRVSYYENDSKPGLDATIFAPSVDLKIQNDTPAAILIETEIDESNMILTFKIYGKKDNRKVEMSPVTVWDVVPPPEPLYQDDPTLPNGVVKQVDYPAWGAKARFNYKVTKTDGSMFEKEFYSSYRPWQAVFLRGTAG